MKVAKILLNKIVHLHKLHKPLQVLKQYLSVSVLEDPVQLVYTSFVQELPLKNLTLLFLRLFIGKDVVYVGKDWYLIAVKQQYPMVNKP